MKKLLSLLALSALLVTSAMAQQLTLVAPNGGEEFAAGNQMKIQWAGIPAQQKVLIEYSTDGGGSWSTIGIGAGNEYLWSVPQTPSTSCLARISLMASQAPLILSGHSGWINSVAYSPEGSRVATNGDDDRAIIWDPATGKRLTTLSGHSGDVYWSAFSPDGSHIITGSHDATARIWNTNTGQALLTLPHPDVVTHVAWDPTGNRVATADNRDKAYIWDTQTGMRLQTLSGHTKGVQSVAFSPDGSMIVTASRDQTIKLWDLNGTLIRTMTGHTDQVHSAEFSPDGKHIVSGGRDNTARIWNVATGQLEHTLAPFDSWVWHASYSPNGTLIATADRAGYVKLWDGTTGTEISSWHGHDGDVGGVWFSPDGTRLLTGANDNLGKIWYLSDYSAADISDNFWSIIVEPVNLQLTLPNGGETLVVGADSYIRWKGVPATTPVRIDYSTNGGESWNLITKSAVGHQYLWRVPTTPSHNCMARVSLSTETASTPLLILQGGHALGITSVAYSPDGSIIATNGNDNITVLWEAVTGTRLRTLTGHTGAVYASDFNPDASRIITGAQDNTARIWNSLTGNLAISLNHSSPVLDVAYSPDGSRVITAEEEGLAHVWNAVTGDKLFTLPGHTNGILSVAISADGSMIATASRDQTIKLWSAEGNLLRTLVGHNNQIQAVTFSPDGLHIASGGRDNSVRIWNTATGQQERILAPLFNSWVEDVAYSPDGSTIATADRVGFIKIWNAVTGVQERQWKGHDINVGGIRFNPDGTRLVSGGGDRFGKVWHTDFSNAGEEDTSDDLWKIVLPSTSVDEEKQTVQDVLVHSIYPNPTYSEGLVNVEAATSGDVRIMITDLSGATVAELFNGTMSAGRHTLRFTADDLPSGTYFLLLKRASEISTHRFTILR